MSNEMISLGSLLPTLYKDVAQPSARTIGKALGQATSLVFSPSGRCLEIAEKNLMKLLDKIDREEKDNIVSPETGIAVPILQRLSYIEEDAVVELYCELLKNACLKNHKSKVLPSYANIISSLTPDEVKIIDFFFNEQYMINLPVSVIEKYSLKVEERHAANARSMKEDKVPVLFPDLPFLEVRSQESNKQSWQTIIKYFTDINDRVMLQNSDNVELYLDNLNALGVISIKNDVSFAAPDTYTHLIDQKEIINLKVWLEELNKEIVFERGSIAFTNLGKSFLESCTRKQPTSPVNQK